MTKHHEVPTHLNVEDKVVFGLSVRQFLQMLVGSSASYTLWEQTAMLPDPLRVGLVTLSACGTVMFALLRPAGRPLEEWLVAALVYAGAPRRSTWRPAEPDAADWRPAAAAWQELTPSLSWAGDDSECD
jgi:PrgI family protein